MDKNLEDFIKTNIDIIDENTKESWEKIYNKLINNMGIFTEAMLDAGIDPAEKLGYIPDRYLEGTYIEEYKIPNNVTSIGDRAFYECSSLTSIEIPDSVTSIGEGAFFYCRSLTSIEIPDGVTSIGWMAFSGCSSLTSVTIGNGVTSIGDYAFFYCTKLTSITFRGTKKKFKELSSGWVNGWRNGSSIERIICSDGEIEL